MIAEHALYVFFPLKFVLWQIFVNVPFVLEKSMCLQLLAATGMSIRPSLFAALFQSAQKCC